jgi:hypothetical protein
MYADTSSEIITSAPKASIAWNAVTAPSVGGLAERRREVSLLAQQKNAANCTEKIHVS